MAKRKWQVNMIWLTILFISFIFVIAITEAHFKADRLAAKIRFLQADMRVQEQINNSLHSIMHTLLKMHTAKIINSSKMEHKDTND